MPIALPAFRGFNAPGAFVVALGVLAVLLAQPAWAQDGRMLRLPTRAGVESPTFWVQQDQAPATLVLLPGGGGGIGALDASGWPGSRNFLIRSGPLFAAQGFNVAMVAKPTDREKLDPDSRIEAAHLDDLHQVLLALKKRAAAPIWIVGTSQGTISATALAIAERDSGLIAGIVLTASFTHPRRKGAVPRQALDQIRVPVLILHHQKDACNVCRPQDVPAIQQALKNAPVHKAVLVDGGSGASGDPCEAEHFHGFIGMEAEAVQLIADWVRRPVP